MSKKNTGMMVDGVFASEAIDSSGEVLSISGLDISTLEEGWGVANYEHLDEKNGYGREVVGKIVYAKKIFSEADCENERQLDYFKKIKKIPYLYGIVRLYDGAGHDGARALAAQIRDAVANDEKIVVRYSIEGATTKKVDNRIEAAIAKKVAMTLKPCNKTAISGMMEDPNAPEGFSSFAKSEDSISGTTMVVQSIYLDPKVQASTGLVAGLAKLKGLRKAMTAGSYDAAPSALSGGAALQREDHRSVANTAKAVIRDYGWGKPFVRDEFIKFAKTKLPEMSDDFIEHFTNVAEDFAVKKLRKDEEAIEASPPPPKSFTATIRGKKVRPNPTAPTAMFNEKNGTLRTKKGVFPAYLPAHDGPESEQKYKEILSHPEIEKAMDFAMENWSKLHQLNKAGKLPQEVLMHGIMFSQLSPNRAVPTQELQFARLADAMKATGLSPDKPGFGGIKPKFFELDKPDTLPETARDDIKNTKAYFTDQGVLRHTAPLANSSLDWMAQYHKSHDGAKDLLNRHKTSSMGAIKEMLSDPKKKIPGLKVKTGLYAWGMLGGGDSVVPDTHFIRHAFGLNMRKDADTLGYLKSQIWQPQSIGNVLEPFNRWYLKNHPAVQYTLNHPKWGSHFEKPEDAIFPSFWRHWLTIAPHERHLGLPNLSVQEHTNHAPFWSTIKPYVDAVEKNEGEGQHDSSIPLRTAILHQQYVKDYGEIPAMFFYYHHIVPKLLEAAKQRQDVGNSMKFLEKSYALEAELIELRKSIAEDDWKLPEVHKVDISIGDKKHPAGRFMLHDGNLHHLEDYHGILEHFLPEGPVDTRTISRLHGLQWPSSPLKVENHPMPVDSEPAKLVPIVSTSRDLSFQNKPIRPSVFSYQRVGMDKAHCVEISNKGATLDGHSITDHELSLLLDNAKKGVAKLTYHNALKKSDDDFENVMSPDEVAKHIRAGVAAGHIHPDVEKAFIAHTYGDAMVPGVGNKYAYNQFRKNGDRPGVWLSMDANSFKHVNDVHGHDAGDHAIKAMGNALKNASAKVGTGKLFRPGGDEFVAHFPAKEDALLFMRHATDHLNQIPPINGAHKLSVSFGVGHDFPSADQALLHAKGQKKDATGKSLYTPENTPHMAHSLLTGEEGPLTHHRPEVSPQVPAMPKINTTQPKAENVT